MVVFNEIVQLHYLDTNRPLYTWHPGFSACVMPINGVSIDILNDSSTTLHYSTCNFVRRFYPYIQYCGQAPQEQFGVKCLAQGHNDMLTAVGLKLSPGSKSSTLSTEPQPPYNL